MTDEHQPVDLPVDLPDEAALADVSALLAQLPRPVVPAEVSQRIAAALAVQARPAPRSSRRWFPAAAAALVVIGASVGYSELNHGTATSSTASAGDLAGIGASLAPQLQAPAVAASAGMANSATSSAAPMPSVAAAPSTLLPGTFAATEAGLASCLTGIGRSGQVPNQVKSVRAAGQAAVALTFLNADGTSADLIVVGTACSATAPHVLGRTTLFLPPG